MNKLKLEEYDYIKGNTALSPKRKQTEFDWEKYEQLKKAKKQRNIRINEKRKKIRSGVGQVITLVFVLGFATIMRDSQVYKIQNSIADLDNKINSVVAENEALNVEILKASSLSSIKNNAENGLGMTTPKKENVIKIDLSENNFSLNENNLNKDMKNGLFENIKDALW